jgi:hypothetical protein
MEKELRGTTKSHYFVNPATAIYPSFTFCNTLRLQLSLLHTRYDQYDHHLFLIHPL